MKVCKSIAERVILDMAPTPTYSSKICRNLGAYNAHIIKIINDLKKEGIIKNSSIVKNNRTKLLELTDKGKKVRELLIKLNRVLNDL